MDAQERVLPIRLIDNSNFFSAYKTVLLCAEKKVICIFYREKMCR